MPEQSYFIHPSAYVDEGSSIGVGTRVWHFVHVMSGANIGADCVLGQNVFVAGGVKIGAHVHIQNNVSVYAGVELEDYVFCGPSCVFTNVTNPRAEVKRREQYEKTLVRTGATLGANSTIVPGITIGRYAFVGAGAVVTHDVPDYALVLGTPAKIKGWRSRHGQRLSEPDSNGIMVCGESGWRYQIESPTNIRCLDWPEESALPDLTEGTQ
jgi:UDP-2-acetamido-3-amino-2,3-dideoxy-glucuronate N-acetyltransferase